MPMIQHINLLSQRRRIQGLDRLLTPLLVLAALALLGTAAATEWRLHRLAQTEARTEQTIADLKAVLAKKRQDSGFDEIQAMAQQSAALRTQMDARRDWADLMQKGELGSPLGHSPWLETLASLHEDGVWLQGVEVSKGGQAMSISGKSMGTESVMRYIGQVNEAFKPMGIQFSSIEITQEAASGDAAKAGILKFKLY
jgi:hypothetical protein